MFWLQSPLHRGSCLLVSGCACKKKRSRLGGLAAGRSIVRMTPENGFVLTKDSLDGLLARLDADRERAGEKYETLRLGLIRFFEWRGASTPVEHADETLDRVARKLHQGEEIRDLPAFVAGVARFVFLEVVKQRT